MLLTIDIGNTNITLGAYDNDVLCFTARLATAHGTTSDQYAVEIKNILELHGLNAARIEDCIISSVVPSVGSAVCNAVSLLCNIVPLELGPGVKTGLNILIDNPAQLGADLAAGAVGAMTQYPLPAFIIDLGTATKVCAVDKNKSFRGCMIAPGVQISLKALTDTSSLLPTISLEPPKKACGTNTVESMQSGVVLGTAAMIDGILDKFAEELGEPATIVATGGLSYFISPVCKREIVYDRHLILKGLKAIYEKNN